MATSWEELKVKHADLFPLPEKSKSRLKNPTAALDLIYLSPNKRALLVYTNDVSRLYFLPLLVSNEKIKAIVNEWKKLSKPFYSVESLKQQLEPQASQIAQSIEGIMEKVLYPCECGATNFSGTTIFSMVQHLNDSHKWTREAIADWLETLDSQPVLGIK